MLVRGCADCGEELVEIFGLKEASPKDDRRDVARMTDVLDGVGIQ
jgi:hypothetical protein